VPRRPGIDEIHPDTEGIDLTTRTAGDGGPSDGLPGTRLVRGLVRTARPNQWIKNVLVGAAPGAAGVLTHGDVLGRTSVAFAAFCLAASGTYFLNDVLDVEADRRHPSKRFRPIAAGIVPVNVGVGAGVALVITGFAVAFAVGWQLGVVIGVYLALTFAYSWKLKHVAVVDIAVVAAGFVIRTIAGGVAADVPISQWFLIVASFGSLFMVAGKRHGEHLRLGDDRAEARSVLADYSDAYLRYVWMVASGVAITAYCLWAFEQSGGERVRWFELSIVPFVLAILRYALLIEAGHGSAPEELVLDDRTLQVLGLLWLLVYGVGVYTRA
jgi:decaprenyl-phosphate phosphoribosyltransferase